MSRPLPPDLAHLAEGLELVSGGVLAFSATLPIKLSDRANGRSAVTRLAGSRRTKSVRMAAHLECRHVRAWRFSQWTPGVKLAVRIVRVSPRALDDDNNTSACKPVRDGVADALGINDRDSRVVWLTSQERGLPKQHAVRIEVYRVA